MLRPEPGSGGGGGGGGGGRRQERSALGECDMEVYIPPAPLASADLAAFFAGPKASRPPQRRYVIQGEQLHFYLLVRCPPESEPGAAEARSLLSQLNVKVHFAEASTMKGILMMEKKKPRIMDDHPRHNAVISGSERQQLMQLANGDLLYSLQASMAVKDEYLNRVFHVVVTVAMPSSGDAVDLPTDAASLRSLLTATSLIDRSPARTLILEVELQQPLTVTFTRVNTLSRTVVRIAAENKHPTLSLYIHDLQFLKNYTKLAREAGGSPLPPHKTSDALRSTDGAEVSKSERKGITENLNFKEYFSVVLEAEEFPIRLAPGEEYCFIASIEPLPEAYAKFFTLKSRNFDSNVLLTWHMDALPCRLLSSYDLHWSAPECRDFLLSVTCKSPVLRNSVFPVCFTVTNLSNETQDLVVTIGEQEAAVLVRRLADTCVTSSANAVAREASTEMQDAVQAGKRSVLCFQHAVELGPVRAASSVSVNVQYVALRDGVAQVSELQIVDKISRRIFKTRQVCDVYVMSPEDWRDHQAACNAERARKV